MSYFSRGSAILLGLAMMGGIASVAAPALAYTVSPSLSTVYVDATNVVADNQSTAHVYVYARDLNGVALQGHSVVLSSNMAGFTSNPSVGYSDANGLALFTVKSSQSGTAAIYAAIDGISLNQQGSVNFTYSGASVSPSNSSLTASKTSAYANGSDPVTFTATARDYYSTPLVGKGVTFYVTMNGGTFNQSGTTDSNGSTNITLTPTSLAPFTVYAVVGGVTLNSVTVSLNGSSQASNYQSTLNASPTSVVANGMNYVYISASIRDVNGNPLINKTVVFTTTLNGQTTTASYVTNNLGQVTYSVQPSTAGTATITASVDGTIVNTITVQYLYANQTNNNNYYDQTVSASQSTVTVYPSSLNYGSGQTIRLDITARNAAGQVLANKYIQVTPSIAMTSNQSTSYTNSYGIGSYTFTPNGTGTAYFTVRVDNVQLWQQPSVQINGYGSSSWCSGQGTLVKLADDGNPNTQWDSAVYYIGQDCQRHAFPNAQVYYSWYSDFNSVSTVSPSTMVSWSLGKNVTYRPGSKMIKFPSVNKVYMVSNGGVLRWVTSEWLAQNYFGYNWQTKVDDVSEAFASNYTYGPDLVNTWDYNVGNEWNSANINN